MAYDTDKPTIPGSIESRAATANTAAKNIMQLPMNSSRNANHLVKQFNSLLYTNLFNFISKKKSTK